jgi:hypothetical protein
MKGAVAVALFLTGAIGIAANPQFPIGEWRSSPHTESGEVVLEFFDDQTAFIYELTEKGQSKGAKATVAPTQKPNVFELGLGKETGVFDIKSASVAVLSFGGGVNDSIRMVKTEDKK